MSAGWEMSRNALIRARSRATWQRIKRLLLSKSAAAITRPRRGTGPPGALEQTGRSAERDKDAGSAYRKSAGLIWGWMCSYDGVSFAVALSRRKTSVA